MPDTPGGHEDGCGCKVGSLCVEYGLDGVDPRLQEQWTAEDGPSVRDLTDWFNKQLIHKRLKEEHEFPLEREVDLFYDLLQSEEIGSGTQLEARNRLEGFNLDVERLENDFVSHQTMYRHLTDCLSITYEREADPDRLREKFDDKAGRLEQRVEMVVTEELDRLSNEPWFTLGEFDVFMNLTVTCRDCSCHDNARVLVANDGCDCNGTERSSDGKTRSPNR